jgi:nicotinamide riboside kinase
MTVESALRGQPNADVEENWCDGTLLPLPKTVWKLDGLRTQELSGSAKTFVT